MKYFAYAIIWIAFLIFSSYMTLKTGDGNYLWFLAMPLIIEPTSS